ncbi:MAG: SLC13 family permease [Alphaproteobacteria bacterium]|nr:SLC13 family permease [Alphaproteobacteria bacterium]MCB9975505.1 SLC13 family permease [Rhodospirillales bacterium]
MDSLAGVHIPPEFHMWFMLALTFMAVYSFMRERLSLEVTSILLLSTLLLYGQIFVFKDETGFNRMDAKFLLAGFANPSLIAVLALLVIGQSLIQTDSLRFVTNLFVSTKKSMALLSILLVLIFVTVLSGFMNNTPLVIIAIPILQNLMQNSRMDPGRIMMPLSFVAILGGMTTLIGSSTNLLVSSTMVEMGYDPIGFFDFTQPAIIMVVAGFAYVLLIVPNILPKRESIKEQIVGDQKEFVAELDIAPDSRLVGSECIDGKFSQLGNMNIKLIQRGGHLILPPFEGYAINAGDIIIVSATRESLGRLLSQYPGFLLSEEEEEIMDSGGLDEQAETALRSAETRVLAKIMITPASRFIDMSLDHVNFHRQFGAIILGIQRRARVVRRRLGRIRLEAGDVLLIAGKNSVVNSLRDSPDFIVLSGSKRDLPVPGKAPVAIGVFVATVALAAMSLLPIPVAAFAGAAMMVGTGCLNIQQATRSIDRKIFLLVGSMLALGHALQVTGGVQYIADLILSSPFASSPLMTASLLFIIVAIATNILTNNACAILFTPIAMSLAEKFATTPEMHTQLASTFAITVIFAANCSFASPIGYQTNLLVMGPGEYRFRDFVKAGVPLVILLWITYIFIASHYFGLT